MPSYPHRPRVAKANLVESFRGEVRAAIPLHGMERLLVVVASLHLCFLPWALGARAPWAQVTSLILGAVCLLIAALPRRYTDELAPNGAFTLHPWSRLLRFPLFWLGLLFLGYALCQALNPAWELVRTGIVRYLQSVPHVEWLPSGVGAPFERMNAWRMLTIWSGAWLLVCALWIGITRRAAAHAILITLVSNGLILGLIGIVQKMTNAKKALWLFEMPAHYFHSTFAYKNHAGTYFNLLVAIAAGLLLWHHVRALRRLERSSPAPVFAFASIVLAAVVFMSGSRTAMLLLAGYIVISLTIYLIWRSKSDTGPSNPAVTGMIAAGVLAFVALAAYFLNLSTSIDQIKRLGDQDRGSITSRVEARNATFDLFRDQPLTGWGAGSFRHAFPIHQQNYSEIYRVHGRVLTWGNAHNDYAQTLAEMGLIGALFPALALGWVIVRFLRLGALTHPAFLLLLIGLSLALAHAWVDFPFQNCAILTTFCACVILTLRWCELENTR